MTHIPLSSFDRFFEPFVGTPANAEAFRDTLIADMQNPADRLAGIPDPYERLLRTVSHYVDISPASPWQSPAPTPKECEQWDDLATNCFSGLQAAVSYLRAVGNLYQANAKAPQRAEVVAQSRNLALRRLFDSAHTGPEPALSTRIADMRGVDAQSDPNLIEQSFYQLKQLARVTNEPLDFSPGFDVHELGEGQLLVHPRYEIMQGAGGCPAVGSRVMNAEGARESALWALLDTVGQVATATIYSQQFPIET